MSLWRFSFACCPCRTTKLFFHRWHHQHTINTIGREILTRFAYPFARYFIRFLGFLRFLRNSIPIAMLSLNSCLFDVFRVQQRQRPNVRQPRGWCTPRPAFNLNTMRLRHQIIKTIRLTGHRAWNRTPPGSSSWQYNGRSASYDVDRPSQFTMLSSGTMPYMKIESFLVIIL